MLVSKPSDSSEYKNKGTYETYNATAMSHFKKSYFDQQATGNIWVQHHSSHRDRNEGGGKEKEKYII